MICVSAFDGISVSYLALQRANINVSKYFSLEVDKYALEISKLNFPEIIPLGDIRNVKAEDILQQIGPDSTEDIILIGGSPCQNYSSLGDGKGIQGEKSKLLLEYLRLLETLKPTYFVLENVASMSKKDRDIISNLVGCQPEMINSALVSGQNRRRLYWSNIKITQPEDKGITLQSVLTSGYADRLKSHTILTGQLPETLGGLNRYLFKCTGQLAFREKYFCELDKTTKSDRFKNMQKLNLLPEANSLYKKNSVFRHLNVHELEALQTLPKDFTSGVSLSQRYKCLGNSFTTDVIAHILQQINQDRPSTT